MAETERAVLMVTRMLREDFLQQSAYHGIDRFSTIDKAYWMLKAILDYYHHAQAALEAGVSLDQVVALPVASTIARMKEISVDEAENDIKTIMDRVHFSFAELGID